MKNVPCPNEKISSVIQQHWINVYGTIVMQPHVDITIKIILLQQQPCSKQTTYHRGQHVDSFGEQNFNYASRSFNTCTINSWECVRCEEVSLV